MMAHLTGNTAALPLCILLFFLLASTPLRGVAPEAQADPATLQGTSSLQHELTQLMYCYATGVDLAGAGDGAAAAQQLRTCFTDDAESVYEFPSRWAHLNFTVTGGGVGLAQTAIEFYGKFGFTRTQHMVTNVVVQRTGETTAIMRSYALAIHAYPDESVWNATVKYLDDVHYINGQWKFVHRRVTLTSLTTAPAWAGAPLGQ
jgi:SnoaL-like domain